MVGSLRSLGQAGDSFSGAITESSQILAEWLQRAVKEASGPSIPDRDVFLREAAFYFVLHLTDRIARSRLQISGRELFMNALLTTLGAHIGEQSLRVRYNESQVRLGQFSKVQPDNGEPLKGTVCWEFAKQTAERVCPTEPQFIPELALAAGSIVAPLVQTFDQMVPVE